MLYSYEYNGEMYSIKLERQPDGSLQATIGEQVYIVTASQIAAGRWLLHVNGERYLAHSAADSEARYVHVNGTQFKLEKVEGRQRTTRQAAGRGDLTAEMPGQVLDVRVQEGDNVQAGDVLVVLEAMKMEIRVTAPRDGIVTKLLVQMGDVVDRGQRLVEVAQSEH